MAQRTLRSTIGRFFYLIRYRVGEYSLRGFVRVLPWIPQRILSLYASFMARLTFALLWKYRSRMEGNVAVALGNEITHPADRRALVWRAWKNFTQSMLETSATIHLPKEKITAAIKIQGEEHLRRGLAKGKGVIALSAHLGSFTMLGARLAAGGYPFSVVVKQPKDKRFARLIDAYRARIGIKTISAKPRKEAVRGILKALRQNQIVLVIADEFKSGGVMVDFMGRLVPAPRGPATLALRTGAVTLPMFATRQLDGSLILSIGPAIEPVEGDDLEQSVIAATALYTRHIEDAIRRYPDQWNWLGFPRNGIVSRSDFAQPESPSHENSSAQRAVG
jgi:Kdo2-lipid IVA lauroyltransferase/acyltransferase